MVSAVTFLYSYSLVTPCQVPVQYSIGTIDPVFALEEAELIAILAEAAAVWSPLTTRTLFLYDEDAPLTVNLIFDERHERFQTKELWQAELGQLASQFRQSEAAYVTAEGRYTALVAEVRTAEAQLAEAVARQQGAVAANQTAEVIESLTATAVSLQATVSQLIDDTNSAIAVMNEGVVKVNQAAEAYNLEAEAYNQQFGSTEEFTQGDFTRDSINVYTFEDREELTQVLAHELGHALGLEHVEGEGSIMYYMVSAEAQSLTPSAGDEIEFRRVCRADTSLQARLTTLSAPVATLIHNVIPHN